MIDSSSSTNPSPPGDSAPKADKSHLDLKPSDAQQSAMKALSSDEQARAYHGGQYADASMTVRQPAEPIRVSSQLTPDEIEFLRDHGILISTSPRAPRRSRIKAFLSRGLKKLFRMR